MSLIPIPDKENPFLGLAFNGVTFTVGSENTDVITVAVQAQLNYEDVTYKVAIPMWLTDDSGANTPSGTAPTGGLAAGTDGYLLESISDKFFLGVTENDGDLDVVITDSGTPTFYLNALLPNGKVVTSGAITFA